jgi:hypothetical protein
VLATLVTTLATAAPAAIGAAEDDAHTDPSAPPRATRTRLDAVVVPLGKRDLRGEYRVRWHLLRSKVGGAVLEDRVEVWAVEQNGPLPPGLGARRLLSATLDGEDVSDARRAELAAQPESSGGPSGRNRRIAGVIDLRIPGIANEDGYAFAERERRGDTCAARFEPADPGEAPDRAARGVLSWNCHTLEPVRLEATRVDNPLFVDSVEARWEFETVDGVAFAHRYRVVVDAGLPFMKRRFDMTIAIEKFFAREDPPNDPFRDTSGD